MVPVAVYGFAFSPFVRKVCVVCEEKGIAYECIPMSPRDLPAEHKAHTPLGKIPFARIYDRWLADSSIICRYIDAMFPGAQLYPAGPWEQAQASFYEEYIDGGAVPKLGPKTVYERFVKPRLMGQPCDEAVVAKAIAEDMPPILAWLDSEITGKAFLVGDRISIGDITIGCFFEGMQLSGIDFDHKQYCHLSRYLTNLLGRPSFGRARQIVSGQLPPG